MRLMLQSIVLIALSTATVSAQIVINEIIPPNTVEIRNLGGGTVDISLYTLCKFPSYNELEDITQICGGDLMIEGGSLIAVNVSFNLSASDGELALYLMNGNFDSPANIIDYVEWGSTGHVRSSVAQAAGIWTNGDFVPAWTGCASLEYDGGGDASTDWVSQDIPTSPCVANTLDGCGGSNCSIAGAGLGAVNCNNNGTPSDPGDDFIAFNLNPSGVDLATTYSVSVSSGSIIPTNANYGSATAFQLQSGSAGAGDVTVTITDDNDPDCTFDVLISDPGTCSDLCVISDAGLSGIFCNDADSPSDETDDFIMFNLDPEGMNLGASYSVSVSSGTVEPTSANYGVLTTFDLNNGSAGSGDVTVTITDVSDNACTAEVVVADPGTCSDECGISAAGLADIACDDNGTGSMDSDDFITFSLDPTGNNLSATYTVSVSSGTVMPGSGTYGASEFFSLNTGSAGSGNVTLTITDSGDPACTFEVVVTDPGACSESCNLTNGGLSGLMCNNNGSTTDPSDDFISFSLNPSGINLGTNYNVSVSTGAINPISATYGAPTAFALNNGSAGGGNVSLTITDGTDPSCTFSFGIIDPGSCSTGCSLDTSGLAMVICTDAGTPADPSDDIISFDLNPVGVNLGGSYAVSVSTGTVNPTTGSFGASTSFNLNNGSAGSGDVVLTITDESDTTCVLTDMIVDPGTCSDACLLTSAGLDTVFCDSNNTPEETDDVITFILNPSGLGLSGGYSIAVSSGSVSPDMASFGVGTTFSMNPGSAGTGGVVATITDLADTTCQIVVTIADPGPCSEIPCEVSACDISTDSETIICVDEGVTDTVLVICHPGTLGMHVAWIVTDTAGVIASLPALGDTAVFTFEGKASGTCLIWRIAWDGVLTGLAVGEDADTLSGCFDVSNPVTVVKQTGTDCISSLFNPDLNALISLYPIPASGTLYMEANGLEIRGMKIVDIIGRTISQVDVTNPTAVDVSALDSGLYYVVLETNRGLSLQRIVIGR